MTEFMEPAAIESVGPHDEVIPPYVVGSTEALRDSRSPGFGDPDLEDPAQVIDPFAVMTMDDVINHQAWGPVAETMIDPFFLGGAPTFPEPRSPSPAPTPFRDFPSRTPTSPSPPTLTIRIPPHTSALGLDSAQTTESFEGNSGRGKAKFYKKGALQAPPHLSNSRNRGIDVSTKDSPPPPPQHLVSLEINSPLTELSASDLFVNGAPFTSPIASSSQSVYRAGEDSTVIGSESGTPPRSTGNRTAAVRKWQNSKKIPYRIVAVNGRTFCHQCRRGSTHPKMECRACKKHYCILCIIKRCAQRCRLRVHSGLDCVRCHPV